MSDEFNPLEDNVEIVLIGEHNVGEGNTGNQCNSVGRLTLVEASSLVGGNGTIDKCENLVCENSDIPVLRITN